MTQAQLATQRTDHACRFCPADATHAVRWAGGRGTIYVDQRHISTAKHVIERLNDDAVHDVQELHGQQVANGFSLDEWLDCGHEGPLAMFCASPLHFGPCKKVEGGPGNTLRALWLQSHTPRGPKLAKIAGVDGPRPHVEHDLTPGVEKIGEKGPTTGLGHIPGAGKPVKGTFEEHGAPSRAVLHGLGTKPSAIGKPVKLSLNAAGTHVTIHHAETGNEIGRVHSSTAMWLAGSRKSMAAHEQGKGPLSTARKDVAKAAGKKAAGGGGGKGGPGGVHPIQDARNVRQGGRIASMPVRDPMRASRMGHRLGSHFKSHGKKATGGKGGKGNARAAAAAAAAAKLAAMKKAGPQGLRPVPNAPNQADVAMKTAQAAQNKLLLQHAQLSAQNLAEQLGHNKGHQAVSFYGTQLGKAYQAQARYQRAVKMAQAQHDNAAAHNAAVMKAYTLRLAALQAQANAQKAKKALQSTPAPQKPYTPPKTPNTSTALPSGKTKATVFSLDAADLDSPLLNFELLRDAVEAFRSRQDEGALVASAADDDLDLIAEIDHTLCDPSVFCRNPLHPGPCKGWKWALYGIAPAAYHAIEKARVGKINERRAARVADLQAKGLKVPGHLLKPVTYDPAKLKPHPESDHLLPGDKGIAHIPTAHVIQAKIGLKHAQAKIDAQKAMAAHVDAATKTINESSAAMGKPLGDGIDHHLHEQLTKAAQDLKPGESLSGHPKVAPTIKAMATYVGAKGQLGHEATDKIHQDLIHHIDTNAGGVPPLVKAGMEMAKAHEEHQASVKKAAEDHAAQEAADKAKLAEKGVTKLPVGWHGEPNNGAKTDPEIAKIVQGQGHGGAGIIGIVSPSKMKTMKSPDNANGHIQFGHIGDDGTVYDKAGKVIGQHLTYHGHGNEADGWVHVQTSVPGTTPGSFRTVAVWKGAPTTAYGKHQAALAEAKAAGTQVKTPFGAHQDKIEQAAEDAKSQHAKLLESVQASMDKSGGLGNMTMPQLSNLHKALHDLQQQPDATPEEKKKAFDLQGEVAKAAQDLAKVQGAAKAKAAEAGGLQRATHAGHGKPTEGVFHGFGATADAKGMPVTIESKNGMVRITNKETGASSHVGAATKFWLDKKPAEKHEPSDAMKAHLAEHKAAQEAKQATPLPTQKVTTHEGTQEKVVIKGAPPEGKPPAKPFTVSAQAPLDKVQEAAKAAKPGGAEAETHQANAKGKLWSLKSWSEDLGSRSETEKAKAVEVLQGIADHQHSTPAQVEQAKALIDKIQAAPSQAKTVQAKIEDKAKAAEDTAAHHMGQAAALHHMMASLQMAPDTDEAKVQAGMIVSKAHADNPEAKLTEHPIIKQGIAKIANRAVQVLDDKSAKTGKAGPGVDVLYPEVEKHLEEGKPGLPPHVQEAVDHLEAKKAAEAAPKLPEGVPAEGHATLAARDATPDEYALMHKQVGQLAGLDAKAKAVGWQRGATKVTDHYQDGKLVGQTAKTSWSHPNGTHSATMQLHHDVKNGEGWKLQATSATEAGKHQFHANPQPTAVAKLMTKHNAVKEQGEHIVGADAILKEAAATNLAHKSDGAKKVMINKLQPIAEHHYSTPEQKQQAQDLIDKIKAHGETAKAAEDLKAKLAAPTEAEQKKMADQALAIDRIDKALGGKTPSSQVIDTAMKAAKEQHTKGEDLIAHPLVAHTIDQMTEAAAKKAGKVYGGEEITPEEKALLQKQITAHIHEGKQGLPNGIQSMLNEEKAQAADKQAQLDKLNAQAQVTHISAAGAKIMQDKKAEFFPKHDVVNPEDLKEPGNSTAVGQVVPIPNGSSTGHMWGVITGAPYKKYGQTYVDVAEPGKLSHRITVEQVAKDVAGYHEAVGKLGEVDPEAHYNSAQKAAKEMGLAWSGNPYGLLAKVENLTPEEHKGMTPSDQQHVLDSLDRIIAKHPGTEAALEAAEIKTKLGGAEKATGPLAHPDMMALADEAKHEHPLVSELANKVLWPGVNADEIKKLPPSTESKIRLALEKAHGLASSNEKVNLEKGYQKLFGTALPGTQHELGVPGTDVSKLHPDMQDLIHKIKAGDSSPLGIALSLHRPGVTAEEFDKLKPSERSEIAKAIETAHAESNTKFVKDKLAQGYLNITGGTKLPGAAEVPHPDMQAIADLGVGGTDPLTLLTMAEKAGVTPEEYAKLGVMDKSQVANTLAAGWNEAKAFPKLKAGLAAKYTELTGNTLGGGPVSKPIIGMEKPLEVHQLPSAATASWAHEITKAGATPAEAVKYANMIPKDEFDKLHPVQQEQIKKALETASLTGNKLADDQLVKFGYPTPNEAKATGMLAHPDVMHLHDLAQLHEQGQHVTVPDVVNAVKAPGVTKEEIGKLSDAGQARIADLVNHADKKAQPGHEHATLQGAWHNLGLSSHFNPDKVAPGDQIDALMEHAARAGVFTPDEAKNARAFFVDQMKAGKHLDEVPSASLAVDKVASKVMTHNPQLLPQDKSSVKAMLWKHILAGKPGLHMLMGNVPAPQLGHPAHVETALAKAADKSVPSHEKLAAIGKLTGDDFDKLTGEQKGSILGALIQASKIDAQHAAVAKHYADSLGAGHLYDVSHKVLVEHEMPDQTNYEPHVQLAHDYGAKIKSATDTTKLEAYTQLTQAEYHSLPLSVQQNIHADLQKMQTKFLDPKKIGQAKDNLAVFGEPSEEAFTHDLPGVPTKSSVSAMDKLINDFGQTPLKPSQMGDSQAIRAYHKTHIAAYKLAYGKEPDATVKAAMHQKYQQLAENASPTQFHEQAANNLWGLGNSWMFKHVPGEAGLTDFQRSELKDHVDSEMKTMMENGLTSPPPGGVLDSVDKLVKSGGTQTQKIALIKSLLANGGIAPHTPEAAKSKDDISHIPADTKAAILAAYKLHPTGAQLKDPQSDQFDLLQAVAKHFSTDKTFLGGLSIRQAAKVVDETHAKNLGVGNANLLEKRIMDWLATPEGAAYLKAHPKPKQELLDGLKGKLSKGVKLTKGQKVQQVGGPGSWATVSKLQHEDFHRTTDDEARMEREAAIKADPQLAAKWKHDSWGGYSNDALKSYTSASGSVNGYLRGHDAGDPLTKKTVTDMQAAMYPLPRHTLLLRGMDWDGDFAQFRHDPDAAVGKILSDPAFLSSSVAGAGGEFGGDVKLEIEAPKGTVGAYLDGFSHFNGEHEFLLAAGTQLKVTKTWTEHGQRWFRVRVVGTKTKDSAKALQAGAPEWQVKHW